MNLSRRDFVAMAAVLSLAPAGARAQPRPALIVALGGASRERPAGTAAAFDLAINQGADFIESGIVATQDGALIARDDHELSASTDIASRPEFAARRTAKTIDGSMKEGWFSEDFSLAELKTLNCVGQSIRPGQRSATTPGTGILTLQEVMDIARAGCTREARVIGVCATLVRPNYFASIDLALEPRTADLIRINGYNWQAAAMIVRSRQAEPLKIIGGLTRARRGFLTGEDPGLILDFATIRSHSEIVCPPASALINLGGPTPVATQLVAAAHAAGLAVQAQALPFGDPFPPKPFHRGDLRTWLAAVAATGADAIATDTPAASGRDR